MIIYFSGTGNSKRVASYLGKLLSDEVYPLLSLESETLKNGGELDSLGIVFPVYGWGVPAKVLEKLQDLLSSLSVCPLYVYALCTCGDDIGYTDEELRRLLQRNGLPLHAVASVQMPETYVALPGFKLDDEALAQEKVRRGMVATAQLAERIKRRERFVEVVRGSLPWLYSSVLRPLFNRLLVSDRYFKVSDACVGCGHCAEVCPVDNISCGEDGGKPNWGGECMGCLACYHHCPTNAIDYLCSKGKGQLRC